jgi:plasmid stabilization system protein ParE
LIVPFGRSAYIVRYAYLRESDEVVILRVWHGREQRE